MVPWPSPRRQIAWRSLIDTGADVVHGHHAHVPQGWERYGNGLIFYGLGNFCVDPAKWQWHPHGLWSLAPELWIKSGCLEMAPRTTAIDDLGETIRIRNANADESEQHQRYLVDCSRPLSDPRMLEGLWQECSVRMYQKYYSSWLGFELPLAKNIRRVLGEIYCLTKQLSMSKFSSHGIYRDKYLLRYHLFACDSHNDAIATALSVLSGEFEDFRSKEISVLVDKMMYL